MDECNKDYFSKCVSAGDKVVTVAASLIDDNEWELSIIGKANQVTSWTRSFPSPEAAIEAGLSAIFNEGIDEFYRNPGFSYMEEL